VTPFSVVIPAHDEETVIGRLLAAITTGAGEGEVEVVVAANGCTDATVAVARRFGPSVKVVEVEQASKVAALNAGDEAATVYPRFYVDADVEVDLDTLRRCAAALAEGPAHCVAPTARFDLTGASPGVQHFYRIWQKVPYFEQERIGMVYGLSASGRSRFDRFPDLTADDQFVAQTFPVSERRCLPDCSFVVHPPRTLRALLANRTRIYRGNRELARSGLAPHPPAGGSARRLLRLATRPVNWPGLALYLAVNAEAKRRGRRPHAGWERDDTSRDGAAAGPATGALQVGYVVSHYPARSHTFVLREVRALRRLGARVETFSIHRTPLEQLISPQDRAEASTTHNLRPVGFGRLVATHLWCAATGPAAYAGTLGRALASSPPGWRARLWQGFYFAEAVLLYREADRRCLRHLHAHLANAGSDVAWWASELGRRRAPDAGWRWSFTMHGPTEFFAVERFNLARKVEAASTVVCISDYCRSQLMLLSPPEQWTKLRVVRCGVDPSEFPFRPMRPVSPPARILCVGRLTPEKGQHLLLQAAARLEAGGCPVTVELAGWGPSEDSLRKEATRLGLGSVHFLGPVAQDRLADLFARADVFCLPSFAEGLPIVLMEAMATGVPVVTTAVAGIPELVRPEETGWLVPPGRPDLLADALADALADPDGTRRITLNARNAIEKDFNLTVNAHHLLEVIGR
jgi:colanic acid/amylovoran biosynthesis glycosyltransferase